MDYCIIFCIFSVFSSVVARDTIFVTDIVADKIWKAPIESLHFEDIPLQYVETPLAVDYDPVDHKLYWADEHFKAIIRANLDGTEEEVVVPYLDLPQGLSIDAQNRHLYWTDAGRETIERANLDGTNRVIISSENHDDPRQIVVDSQGGRMYWTDWGNNPKIERANLDCTNRVVLVDTNLEFPNGLALDFEGNRIYWCDAGLNAIDTTDLNGQNRFNLGTFRPENNDGVDIRPFDIGVYNNSIYWTDFAFEQIIQMNKLVGRGAKGVGPAIFEKAGGLHIFIDEVNECSSYPCNTGKCIDEINFYTCVCTSTGFEGNRCEIHIDDCAASPCLNAGICTDLINAFSCQCTPGFHGDLCQYNNDDCAASPCLNSGICTDLVNAFLCECVPGFYGNLCQHNVDDCAASPCLNAGICKDLDNAFSCQCVPGFYGDECQYNYDDCAVSPCLHAGICTDLVNAFSCECVPGFYGNLCQHKNQPEPVTSTESPTCIHPGYIDNGHVIQGNNADTLLPGTSLEFECVEGYHLVGAKIVHCQIDGTWSEKVPTCIADSENQPEPSTESPTCVHPGDIDNAHVIHGNKADTLVPGTSLEFVCAEEYHLVGAKIVHCQIDGTWSDIAPSCVADSEPHVNSSVAYGSLAGGVLLIVILLFIMIVVYSKNRSRIVPIPIVHYTANGSRVPEDPTKDTADYSTIHYHHDHREPALGIPVDGPAMPIPRGRMSNHNALVGDGAVGEAWGFPSENPPSYASVNGNV